MKAFICMVEKYNGNRTAARTFAESREEARKKNNRTIPSVLC